MHRVAVSFAAALTICSFSACPAPGAGKDAGAGAPAAVAISIQPATSTITVGQLQQFSVVGPGGNAAVTWKVQEAPAGGAISAGGTYTAPAEAGTYHVIATSTADATKSATATVTVTPPVVNVTISPPAASLELNGTKQFAANVTGSAELKVTWSVTESTGGGTVSESGLYAGPGAAGIFHVVATSVADPTKSASATVTVIAPLTTEETKKVMYAVGASIGKSMANDFAPSPAELNEMARGLSDVIR